MAEHTSGPWKQHGFRVYVGDLDGGLARTVADCNFARIRQPGKGMSVPEFQEAEANARLIAAAPSLLEAVEDALDRIDAFNDLGDRELSAFRAAVAKARGG